MAMLFTILFWTAVGVVVGWNVTQPDWAKQAQDQAMQLIGKLTGKISNNDSNSH